VKQSMTLACVLIGAVSLCACTQTVDCSGGAFRGGCAPGTASPASASPTVASPAVASPAIASPVVTPGTVGRGDPSAFADVDDKQCRSYGLAFGSRDYADCRIRLSAQHRGLDPNIGTTTAGPQSR
jgi:hypothetical protein